MSNKLTKQERIEKASKDYTNELINSTIYTGNTKPNTKIFSASSLGSEMLQTYLAWKYGKKDKISFQANTIGSIYQTGCDQIFDNNNEIIETNGVKQPRYKSKYRINYMLPNGWTVSGETDQLDFKYDIIFDNKVISGSAYKNIIQNSPDHDYNLQQAVYQFLLEKTLNKRFEAMLSIVNKSGAAIRNDIYTVLHLNTHSSDVIEHALISETDSLQYYIDNDINPPQCDIFKYGKTKDIPNRCALYCDHNNHCPYYSEHKQEKDILSKLSMI